MSNQVSRHTNPQDNPNLSHCDVTSQQVDDEISSLLMTGEQVLLVASQARALPGGTITTPNKIYVTNMRVIHRDPKLLNLSAKIIDVAYRDIANINLKRGLFSTAIFLHPRFHSLPVDLPAVDKQVAQQIMTLIQKGMRGELPGQVLTEDRNAPVQAREPKDPLKELEKLGVLRDKGLITEQEFWKLKAELIRKF